MRGSLLKSIWRGMTGNAAVQAPPGARSGEVSLQSEVRAALASLLREPLAHPKTVDYEMVAHLMAATSSADCMINHMMGARSLVRRSSLQEFALGEDRAAVVGPANRERQCDFVRRIFELPGLAAARIQGISGVCRADGQGLSLFILVLLHPTARLRSRCCDADRAQGGNCSSSAAGPWIIR